MVSPTYILTFVLFTVFFLLTGAYWQRLSAKGMVIHVDVVAWPQYL